MFPPFPLLSKVIQKLRTTQEGEVILIAPWWPSQPWCPHTTFLCGPPALLSVQPGHIVTTGICLGWQVVCMLGVSHATVPNSRIFEEVSRLVAAPRRPSTYTVYNDRWLRFAHWTAGQGIDPLGPIAAQIATFLYYLFDNQGLSP